VRVVPWPRQEAQSLVLIDCSRFAACPAVGDIVLHNFIRLVWSLGPGAQAQGGGKSAAAPQSDKAAAQPESPASRIEQLATIEK
jgi:hypothetical protein